ncbi:MAG: methyltransferase domain-containing protein [Bacteroidales bacterium]|nr:methyltransferase domain-containing protein [Bacteroidales bacterium]
MKQTEHICPVEKAGILDSIFRRSIQNPKKIIEPYVSEGEIVMDLGCGPGFFTVEMAKIVRNTGKVFAVDVQQGMLELVAEKIKGSEYQEIVYLHKAEFDNLNFSNKVDFILAFYVVHEINRDNLFAELRSILNPDGKILIVEPNFHISKKVYNNMLGVLEKEGFEIILKPTIFLSRAVLLKPNNTMLKKNLK